MERTVCGVLQLGVPLFFGGWWRGGGGRFPVQRSILGSTLASPAPANGNGN